jgi:hypothetical protein
VARAAGLHRHDRVAPGDDLQRVDEHGRRDQHRQHREHRRRPGHLLQRRRRRRRGRLLNIRADNPQFNAAALHVDYNGAGNAVEIVNSGTGSPSVTLNVVSSNPNDTTLGISGQELGRGTAKITHTGTGNDANASALSLRLNGAGTAAQGIFLDATNGTTGKLLNLRNAGDTKIAATSDGKLLATGGLGVGNSAPASSITGGVVRKIEVFDRNGASLGYVPVYTSMG